MAELNEDPFNSAMDLAIVRLCFYGTTEREVRRRELRRAPAWLGAHGPEILEELDLLEAEAYVKDRTRVPVRLQHLTRRRGARASTAAPSGSALVVDLGFNEGARPASVAVATLFQEALYTTTALIHDRSPAYADPRGVASSAYVCEIMCALYHDATLKAEEWAPRFKSLKMSASASGHLRRFRASRGRPHDAAPGIVARAQVQFFPVAQQAF